MTCSLSEFRQVLVRQPSIFLYCEVEHLLYGLFDKVIFLPKLIWFNIEARPNRFLNVIEEISIKNDAKR